MSDVLSFFVLFSSRRRHTRCSLVTVVQTCALPIWTGCQVPRGPNRMIAAPQRQTAAPTRYQRSGLDRKSVVKGKSVTVRVDVGGSRIIKKKNTRQSNMPRRIHSNAHSNNHNNIPKQNLIHL